MISLDGARNMRQLREIGKWTGKAVLWTEAEGLRFPGYPSPEGVVSGATAIGVVIGSWSTQITGQPSRALVWTKRSGMRDLGTLGGLSESALAIDDQGVIVGSAAAPDGSTRPVMWIPGRPIVELPFDGKTGLANGINGVGLIVGATDDRATLWIRGRFPVDIDPGLGTWSFAVTINRFGQALGRADRSVVVSRPRLPKAALHHVRHVKDHDLSRRLCKARGH